MSVTTLKNELRKHALHARNNAHEKFSDLAPHIISSAFFAHILPLLPPVNQLVVATYFPIKSEINPLPLAHTLHLMGATLALPVIIAPEKPLKFAPYAPGDTLQKGPFNTQQPHTPKAISPNLIITPLLAFDNLGFRLGYGGGFYDRTIPLHPQALSLGIAYEQQRSQKNLPTLPSDIPLNAVITTEKTNLINPQKS
jgi:5-formyltetrahydrofolate cyclo-ligase